MSPEITYPLYVALAFYVFVGALIALGLFCVIRALVRGVLSLIAPRSEEGGKALGEKGPAPMAPEPGKA